MTLFFMITIYVIIALILLYILEAEVKDINESIETRRKVREERKKGNSDKLY